MYPGGKNAEGACQNIINQIPPHGRYIELCLGSGAVLNHKKPALENHGVEINAGSIAKFNYMPFAYIHNHCMFDWVKKNPGLLDNNTFVYIDPPYPKDSRKSQADIYEYEFTDCQHQDLLKLILTMPAMVAVSTYKNSLYSKALKNWRLHTFQAQTRRGPATECLYMNYPQPEQLHEYTFLGEDHTDRQRIKRKVARHISKLKGLPPLEMQAVICGILSSIDGINYTVPISHRKK